MSNATDEEREARPLARNVTRVRDLIQAGHLERLVALSGLNAATLRSFALGGKSKIKTVVAVASALEDLDEARDA